MSTFERNLFGRMFDALRRRIVVDFPASEIGPGGIFGIPLGNRVEAVSRKRCRL